MYWNNPTEKPSTLTSTNKYEIHSVDSSITTDTNIAAVIRRAEVLETHSASQLSLVNQLHSHVL